MVAAQLALLPVFPPHTASLPSNFMVAPPHPLGLRTRRPSHVELKRTGRRETLGVGAPAWSRGGRGPRPRERARYRALGWFAAPGGGADGWPSHPRSPAARTPTGTPRSSSAPARGRTLGGDPERRRPRWRRPQHCDRPHPPVAPDPAGGPRSGLWAPEKASQTSVGSRCTRPVGARRVVCKLSAQLRPCLSALALRGLSLTPGL